MLHVIARGNNKQHIYLDDEDRRRFLVILSQVKARSCFRLFGYCLMPNHFHLLLQIGRFSISRIMHDLLARYSQNFNARRERCGHLFQGRFKSLLCARDSYLLELIRYIHLNPVRSGLVVDPIQWPWSSHRDYLSSSGWHGIDRDICLSMLATRPEMQAVAYEQFIRAGMGSAARGEAPHVPDLGALVEELVVTKVQADAAEVGIVEIGQAVARETGISIREIRGRRRHRSISSARHVLIHRAIAHGLRPSEIAAFINVSPAAVSAVSGRPEKT